MLNHYIFSKDEIENITKKATEKNCTVIMTEKDYFKIKDFKLNNIDYLQVNLEINLQEKLLSKIIKLYDKKN